MPSISKLSRFQGREIDSGRTPAGLRLISLERHHHLSESAAFTTTSKRGGYLLEGEDLVNVDPHLSSDAEVGKRLEVRPIGVMSASGEGVVSRALTGGVLAKRRLSERDARRTGPTPPMPAREVASRSQIPDCLALEGLIRVAREAEVRHP